MPKITNASLSKQAGNIAKKYCSSLPPKQYPPDYPDLGTHPKFNQAREYFELTAQAWLCLVEREDPNELQRTIRDEKMLVLFEREAAKYNALWILIRYAYSEIKRFYERQYGQEGGAFPFSSPSQLMQQILTENAVAQVVGRDRSTREVHSQAKKFLKRLASIGDVKTAAISKRELEADPPECSWYLLTAEACSKAFAKGSMRKSVRDKLEDFLIAEYRVAEHCHEVFSEAGHLPKAKPSEKKFRQKLTKIRPK